ncbi:MAG: hypothetical protein ACRDAV_03920, partial [Plesiomonas shigelloides]
PAMLAAEYRARALLSAINPAVLFHLLITMMIPACNYSKDFLFFCDDRPITHGIRKITARHTTF